MKNRILSAALCLLLLLSCGPLAFADVIYPAPGDVEAGSPLEHLAATVAPESSVNAAANTLPDGVNVETAESADGLDIYLRGTPDVAGYYYCVITVAEESTETAPSTLSIPVHVTAAMPELQVSDDVTCSAGDTVELSVTAYAGDGSSLSYQWYASLDGSTDTSIYIEGATQPFYQPSTGSAGVYRYYCVVTSSNNGEQAVAVSPVITVNVQDAAPVVQEPTVIGIALATPPIKLLYSPGDTLDISGLRIGVSYSDSHTEFLDSGFTVSPAILNVLGEQEITVSYGGYSCSYYVTVEPERITEVKVHTLPYRSDYLLGDSLDISGLSLEVVTNTGSRIVNSGFQYNPTYLNQSGPQIITVYYEGFSCSFNVQVSEPEKVTGLMVLQLPYKTSYLAGETLDVSGLVLRQITSYGNSEDIYSGFTVSPSRLDRSGSQEIVVQYNGLSCSFRVNVSQPQASPVPTVRPTAVPTTQPTAFPSPSPSAFPAASPSPSVQPVVSPSPTPRSTTAARQANMAKTLVAVIVFSAVLALGVLGVYLYVANRGGFEEFAAQLRDLFRRRK